MHSIMPLNVKTDYSSLQDFLTIPRVFTCSNMNLSLSVNISLNPFSFSGSLLSLSQVGLAGSEVHLVSHCRDSGTPLLTLFPDISDAVGNSTVKSTSSLLQWQVGDKAVAEATFQDERCIRFRGSVPLAFQAAGGDFMYQRPTFETGWQTVEYSLEPIKNHIFILLKGKLDDEDLSNLTLQVEADETDLDWDLLFCEIENDANAVGPDVFWENSTLDALSTDVLTKTTENDAEFNKFTNQLCPWSAGNHSTAESLASYVEWSCTVRAGGRFTRDVVIMSKNWMNRQWSWDNCFNALALEPYSIDFALDQIQIPFDYQSPEGRLPDYVQWGATEWAYTKPPIQGWALGRLLKRQPNMNTTRLLQLYQHTAKFTDFWMRRRRTDQSALPWYAHGGDSGWDNSSEFDEESMVVSADCAAYLIIQADILAQVSLKLGLSNEESEKWTHLKDQLTKAVLGELWNGQSFAVKDAFTGETRPTTSLLRLVPLVAAAHLPTEVVAKMVQDLDGHLTEWGLATEKLDSPIYQSDGYWRGPIWAPPTLLIESGLRAANYTDLADTISDRFIELCEKSGFAENYDAKTGAGQSDPSYTWSASVFLVLSRERAERRVLQK